MEKEKGLQAPVVNVVLPANYGLPPPVVVQPLPLIQKPTGLIPSTLNEGPPEWTLIRSVQSTHCCRSAKLP